MANRPTLKNVRNFSDDTLAEIIGGDKDSSPRKSLAKRVVQERINAAARALTAANEANRPAGRGNKIAIWTLIVSIVAIAVTILLTR